MKKTLATMIVLALMVGSTAAWSQGGGPGRGQGGPGGPGGPGRPGGQGGPMMMMSSVMAVTPLPSIMLDQLAQMLQLSDEQLTSLKDIAAKYETAIKPLQKKSMDATIALRSAILAADFSAEKVKQLAVTAQKSETVIINANIDQWVQIREVLSVEQIAQLQQMMNGPRQGSGAQGPGVPPPPPGGQVPPSPQAQ